jgi:AcrR family transcriptional regulator
MKEQILKKANEMFLTFGFKSVTMDDIAAELAISKKTIYQHFANKNDLVEASSMSLFHKISDGIDVIRAEKHNPIEEFFIIREYMSKILKDESVAPLYQLQKFFPQIHKTLRTYQFKKMHESMLENLQRGLDGGLYREDLDFDFISRIYFSGMTAIKDSDVFPDDAYTMSLLTKSFIEYHLRAIVTNKGLEILTKTLSRKIF